MPTASENGCGLRSVLRESHALNVEPATAADHTRNCHILIDWIEANLSGPNEIGRDPHWTPQHFRMETIRAFDMKVLKLSGLDESLSLLLSDIVPDIGPVLASLERYATSSKEMKNKVLDPALKARIIHVYKRDAENYDRLCKVWKDISPKTGAEIPRATQVCEQDQQEFIQILGQNL